MFRDTFDNQDTPPGFNLRHTFHGHKHSKIYRMAWSPDGRILAASFDDMTIHYWDIESGREISCTSNRYSACLGLGWSSKESILASGSKDSLIRFLNIEGEQLDHTLFKSRLKILDFKPDSIFSIAWSPGQEFIASGHMGNVICLWKLVSVPVLNKNNEVIASRWVKTELESKLEVHSDSVYDLAWSPDGHFLASASGDKTINIWDSKTNENAILNEHSDKVYAVAWSPDGKFLASGSEDNTVRLWEPVKGRLNGILEGHTDAITSVSFSMDGRLLASKSFDGTVKLWKVGDTWDLITTLDEPSSRSFYPFADLAFHPLRFTLATLDKMNSAIRIWDLDIDTLLGEISNTVHYTNAKVVLVGDTGVGKSGLALALTQQPFQATESTHGRRVWTLESQEINLNGGRKETREILLWDLAGQPSYRLIHQLHLAEVAIALVVFDSRSETEPFAGVRYWNRALCQAERIQGGDSSSLRKFLVAARTDRGGIGVSPARIKGVVSDLGFRGYFQTSAKEGWGIAELIQAIHQEIDWAVFPKVISTELFQQIKIFLITEKEAARTLSTANDLFYAFLRSEGAPSETPALRAQFDTCIGRLEARGLIRRLSFQGLILLQPELLDVYASAMVNAAKDEPDGLGYLFEEDARSGRFRMPESERITDKDDESLLLIATVEDLLRHEIALKESTDAGPLLVFPSQFTRENPDAPDPEGKSVIFDFEGPILNIYTTLAVRLSRSGLFKKENMWKNAATFNAIVGGRCGIFLREFEEGKGEFILFFDKVSSKETRIQFETYIETHLQRRALPNSIKRRRIIACHECGESITDRQIRKRRERGHDWIQCNVCEAKISLEEEKIAGFLATEKMDFTANILRDHDTATAILQGKIATNDFDVFLAHNSLDKEQVKIISEKLKQVGVYPWIDVEQIPPGRSIQESLEQAITRVKSAAIFIGPNQMGRWQVLELRTIISRFIESKLPVIPVLLPGTTNIPEELIFLKEFNWISFSNGFDDIETLNQLKWGITGQR